MLKYKFSAHFKAFEKIQLCKKALKKKKCFIKSYKKMQDTGFESLPKAGYWII